MAQGSSSTPVRAGVVRKPLVEKLKLLALFAVIGVLVYISRPTPTTFWIGAVLVTIGALIRVWAGGHLTRDQRLSTSGPYQYTRNPFYLGRFFLIIGYAIMSGLSNDFSKTYNIVIWGILLFSLAFFFFGYMPRKERREGGRLKEMFGPDYETWKANVPQLFPRLTPYVMNPRPWSKDLFMGGDGTYTGNKELWTTIATFALVALFFLRMQIKG
jgi:protein-S-isoprenylcysteine O-methyltransferase Ste14